MNIQTTLLLTFVISLSACKTLPKLDPDKIYKDTGTVLRRVGDGNCRIEVITDNYGFKNTGTMGRGECMKWSPKQSVVVEIYDAYWIRIISSAAH